MIRWLGAALLVLSASLLGINGYLRSCQRQRALKALVTGLGALRSELTALKTPLPELLGRLGATQPQPAGEFFGEAAARLRRRSTGLSDAWEAAVKNGESLCLRPEEEQALVDLGRMLGKSGAEAQGEAILRAEKKLELFLELEEREYMKQSRVRAAVGAGAGVMLAILLL